MSQKKNVRFSSARLLAGVSGAMFTADTNARPLAMKAIKEVFMMKKNVSEEVCAGVCGVK